MRRLASLVASALLVPAALLSAGTSSNAAESASAPEVPPTVVTAPTEQPTISPGEKAAVDRVMAGTHTAADIVLIKLDPALAALVPDPAQEVSRGVTSSGATAAPSDGAAAARCYWADVWFQQKSLLGQLIFRWNHYVSWCATSVITGWTQRYDYLSKSNGLVYMRGIVDKGDGPGRTTAKSFKQRDLEYCILKLGCYTVRHPWSRITAYNTGHFTYEGSKG